MSLRSPNADHLAEVKQGFRTLPERYLGAEPGFDVTYHIKLCDLGHTWEVGCTGHAARVRQGATRRRPDVTISTDAGTWLALRQGTMSGIDEASSGEPCHLSSHEVSHQLRSAIAMRSDYARWTTLHPPR